jgi:hypothetical protein
LLHLAENAAIKSCAENFANSEKGRFDSMQVEGDLTAPYSKIFQRSCQDNSQKLGKNFAKFLPAS